jgi:chemotaxis methyl-accepting protein methylase
MFRLDFPALEYRHVVFPDADAGDGAPINFTPMLPCVIRPVPAGGGLTPEEVRSHEWLFGKIGLGLGHYRPETLKRRLIACKRALRVTSVLEVCDIVERHPLLLQRAINTLLIGVSSFFRDSAVFDGIRDQVLPALLQGSNAPRIWSAGCSDGSELYSIAMLLAEKDALRNCHLLGTDCRVDAIERARAGCFASEGIAGVPEELKSRYFSYDRCTWRARSDLRAALHWRFANVLGPGEEGLWDMILCRNLAIYLQSQTAGQLWARLERCLRPGGFLVLGKAERPTGRPSLRAIAPCIFQREES